MSTRTRGSAGPSAAGTHARRWPRPAPEAPPADTARFTLDGSNALEQHLATVCATVVAQVSGIIPASRLEAVVLGGGYGRGQGGVLRTASGDQPYNDLEFYVFTRGSRLWNERRYGDKLRRAGDRALPDAGVHVEFKIESLDRLRRSPVTMYSYDLVCGHRVLWVNSHLRGYRAADVGAPGSRSALDESVFSGCEHHLDAGSIPNDEATRLLFNRCTGLLLVRELLQQNRLDAAQADFIGRNLAKVQLAFGDAVLASVGQYHWSCLERQDRLNRLEPSGEWPWLAECRQHHQLGVEFKLHPRRILKSAVEFVADYRPISVFASRLWLWLESRRLNHPFATIRQYAASRRAKQARGSRVRNVLLNARAFGPASVFDRRSLTYPRERLLNALPLLLWEEPLNDLRLKRYLQKQLRASASDWQSLVAAYKAVWPAFS